MSKLTAKLKLLIQRQDDFYNIDKFNENFEKLDTHAREIAEALKNVDGRNYVSETEPELWTSEDVWWQIISSNERDALPAAVLRTSAYNPSSKYSAVLDGILFSVDNATDNLANAVDGEIIIEIKNN